MSFFVIDKKCEKCGHKLTIYYKEMCPACDPIEKMSLTYVNMIIVLNRLEVNRPGGQDRVWTWLCDGYSFSNDSFIRVFFPPPSELTGLLADDIAFIRELLDISDDDGMMFEFSW